MEKPSPCDVLVVGAGPTGLLMACQLARHGVRFRIIDDRTDRAHESRAFGIQARSLEILHQLGLADEFVARARKAEPVCAHANGQRIAELRFDALVGETRYPAIYLLPQPETERILLDDLAARGITVERPVRLVSFTEDFDGITAELDGETIRCQYVVGCDGAHSRVREILDVPFEGATYPSEFVLADVRMPLDAPLAFYLTGRAIMLVGAIGELVRVMGVAFDEPPTDAPVSIDEINALACAAQAPFQIERAEWMSRFRLHHRATRRYRVGRAFLAGDACHIHTPLGGQGMNTGFQDATNLAWKLALVLRGSPPELLDTYELERARVGEKLVHTTDRAFGLITSRRRGMATIRGHVAPFVIRHIMGSPRLRARLVRFFSQLEIRYEPNEFVTAVADGADHAFRHGVCAGSRVPGLLQDRLRGVGIHVLAFGCDDRERRDFEQRLEGRVRVHRITARDVRERFGVTDSAVYVIRPDGYVGFRSHGPSLREAEEYLDELLGMTFVDRSTHASPTETTRLDRA